MIGAGALRTTIRAGVDQTRCLLPPALAHGPIPAADSRLNTRAWKRQSVAMAIRIQCLCVDSADPAALAAFWESVLGWRRTHDDEDEVAIEPPAGSREDGVVPDLLFVRVPEDKSGKNRLHLDLRPGDQESEVERVLGLGARAGYRRAGRRRELGRARRPRRQRVLHSARPERRRADRVGCGLRGVSAVDLDHPVGLTRGESARLS